MIIPNYNYGYVLGQCLEAVRAQTYPDIEIVLVDDCSTDDSVAVARAMGVELLSRPRNGGVCVARNLGVEHASGEILFFLDSRRRPRPRRRRRGGRPARPPTPDRRGLRQLRGDPAQPGQPGAASTATSTATTGTWSPRARSPGFLPVAIIAIPARVGQGGRAVDRRAAPSRRAPTWANASPTAVTR